ncbi:unnamed protein product [Callosobruchus maculatus]|nr:unnamed protein product [Callosobruchus maculatus]
MASDLLNTDDPEMTIQLLRAAALIDQDSAIFEYGNVLVQRTYFENDSVRIISGGPACLLDLVGRGMLTCYIQGDHLMAPPSSLILRTIRELSYNHLKGSLILLPADSGTLLNFGVAIERALNDNLKVKIISISDDFENDSKGKIRKRGLSGIVLMSKIAGAMSERSKTLTEIYDYCSKVLDNMKSIGFTVPTSKETIPVPCTCMEKIQEIYEPEAKKRKAEYDFKQEICAKTYDALLHKKEVPEEPDVPGKINLVTQDRVVILLNINKALTKVEQYMCAKAFIDYLDNIYVSVYRLYIGQFICELDKINLTVTIFKPFDYAVVEYLDDACKAPGWHRMNLHKYITVSEILMIAKLKRKDRLSPPIRGPKLSEKLSNVLLYSAQFACEALISCEKQLNMIDSERGKGDTGSRLKRAAETLLKRMQQDKVITNCPFAFLESMSKLLERTVGGATGCIYSIMFEAAALVFGEMQEEDIIMPETWLHALEQARDALKSCHSAILFLNPVVDVLRRIAILAFLFGVGNSLKKVRRGCVESEYVRVVRRILNRGRSRNYCRPRRRNAGF